MYLLSMGLVGVLTLSTPNPLNCTSVKLVGKLLVLSAGCRSSTIDGLRMKSSPHPANLLIHLGIFRVNCDTPNSLAAGMKGK